MNQIKLIYMVLAMIGSIHLAAQENYAVVYGKIKDSKGIPIAHAKIKVSGTNHFERYSNQSGAYEWVICSNCALQIEFSIQGYTTLIEKTPMLAFQQKYELNITLYREEEEKNKSHK
jgi:hypothetical protein